MIKEYPMELLAKENNKINRCIYVTPRGTVIKNCEESANYADPLDIRLKSFCDIGPVVSFTYPYFLLANEFDWIYGYEMEYLKDYKTLISFIKDDFSQLSFEKKKLLLLQIYKDLKRVNKSFIVGDINLSNILVDSNGHGKIIDWENGYPINSTLDTLSLYEFDFLSPSQQDALKMFIASISLLYKTDFESLFSSMTLSQIYDFCIDAKLDESIINYLSDFMYLSYTNSKEVIYYDDYINSCRKITESMGNRTRCRVNKEIYIYDEKR